MSFQCRAVKVPFPAKPCSFKLLKNAENTVSLLKGLKIQLKVKEKEKQHN
jgi:hypothetical protein